MTDHLDAPLAGTVVNFADFVARRQADAGPSDEAAEETKQLELEFPAPPRALSSRAIAHRRRMLTHLISAARR